MRIKITQHAYHDLESVYEYLSEENASIAKKTILRILDAIEALQAYPAIGRPGRLAHTREFVISRTPFIVIYKVREDIIFILRIYHAARKWPPLTKVS